MQIVVILYELGETFDYHNAHALAHKIEDTKALDVVKYYYISGSLNVQIQYNQ